MKLYYVVNARLPNEKAHGIQIAKTCESFIEVGRDVVLVVPNRQHVAQSMQEFYGLRTVVPIVYLPCFDLYTKGRFGFLLSSLSFIASYLGYFLVKIVRGEKFVFYSVDMDTFSMTLLTLLPRPFFSELHGARKPNVATNLFFRFASGIIAINDAVKEIIREKFSQSVPVLVESNGVDVALFDTGISPVEARTTLQLPGDKSIALFVGRFYAWKDVGILIEAAAVAPDILWYVIGGSEAAFLRVTGLVTVPVNLRICGDKPALEVPLWLAAADTVLALGTHKNIDSWRFTSPMKVFEYMASNRPIVASRTPALQSILSESEVYFYTPDDAVDMAAKVREAIAHTRREVTERAHAKALTHAWNKRATRILEFIDKTANV